jgi:hypothetical protein
VSRRGRPIVALSVRQPFAWLITHGIKPVENRVWRTNYRGPILIHAGQRWFEDAEDYWPWSHIPRPAEHEFQRGGIVGEATIADCVTAHRSGWFQGPYGFVLTRARPLLFRPCPGMPGLFRPV